MTFHKQLRLLASSIFCLSLLPFAAAENAPATPAPAAAAVTNAAPVTEDGIKARYTGKLIFLRGAYLGDELNFDTEGKVKGSPATSSFTLSALEIKKISLSKHKLDIEADRYGLHFLGGTLYEEDANKSYDRVKISKKPVHISIDRELVVIPKVKKEKEKKDASPEEQAAIAALEKSQQELQALAPAHSNMMLNKAMDSVLSTGLDPKMLSGLPDYWQEYFRSQSQHKPYMPADAAVRTLGDGVTAPKVLNSIDPVSNQYAQEFGIAGVEMVRTVVDANGVPRQMAIGRPIGFGLDEKAVEAVKNSRFRAATLNGQPVPVIIDLVVTFRIYSDGTQPGSVSPSTKNAVLSASNVEGSASLNQ
jgi:outer membrane biosynthesis protein TonB